MVAGSESLLGVSCSTGYEPDDAGAEIFGERAMKMHRVVLISDRFRCLDGEVVTEGFTDGLRAMMGARLKEVSL